MIPGESLDLRIVKDPIAIDVAQLSKCSTLGQAISECVRLSQSLDKAVAIDAGIDPATLARLKSDEAGIKGDLLARLMDATGNEFPLMWLLHSRGYDVASLRRLETETERLLRLKTEECAKKDIALATMAQFLGAVVTGRAA